MSPCKLAGPLALASAVAVLLVIASGAAASTKPFGCEAVALRAVLSISSSTFEPTVASRTPCADASTTGAKPGTAGALRIGTAGAFTHVQSSHEAPGAGAFASQTNVLVNGAGHQIVIGDARAQASYTCEAGSLASASDSAVAGVSVDGKAVLVSPASKAVRVSIASDGSYLMLNDVTAGGTSLTRTAAFLHLVGVGNFTIAAATVAETVDPCAGSLKPGAPVLPCPLGSSYDQTRQGCLITAFTNRPIFVTAPFGIPTGGTVESLGHARATLKGAHCLGRSGPSYVVLGTPGPGELITGTSRADRIVVVGGNHTIDGGGGRDCIAVGGGVDVIRDGNAKLRVFGGTGTDTITLGNGNDRISPGPGVTKISVGNGNNRIVAGVGLVRITAGGGRNYIRLGAGHHQISVGSGDNTIFSGVGFDQIRAGNGANTIMASPGIEQISVGTGNDLIVGSAGFDEITARGAGAKIRCGVGRDLVTVNPGAVSYARRHGCTSVRPGA